MKKRIMLIATFALTSLLFSQKTFAQVISQFSLQQCIDYSLEHYTDVQNAQLDIDEADARIGEVRGLGLPQVNGNISVTDNPALKKMFLRGGTSLAPPGSDPNSVVAINNFFQLRTTGDMSLTLNQLLFDGSYIVGLKAANVFREIATKSMLQTKIQVVENVTKAFYVVLINHEQLELVKANVARLDTLLSNTQASQKQGFVEEIDVDRIEVTRNNLNAELTKFNQMNQVMYLLLKFQIGMPLADSLVLSGSIRDVKLEALDVNQMVNPENRVEYSLLKTQQELALLEVKNMKVKYLPSIGGFATGGYTRSDLDIQKTFQNQWYSYMMWGVSVNVPILEGGSKYYRLKQVKYRHAKSENDLQQFGQTVELQVKRSVISLNNEMENLAIQKRNLDLANKVVSVSKIKYTAGTGSNLEVIDAENAFKSAQTNYYNAAYSVLVAKIEYQKSTGTLYSGQ